MVKVRKNARRSHRFLVEIAEANVLRAFNGNSFKILVVPPIPDIIVVDFDKREIIGVEISKHDQTKEKTLSYVKNEGFDRLVLARFVNGKTMDFSNSKNLRIIREKQNVPLKQIQFLL
jgi:hypothetical protein